MGTGVYRGETIGWGGGFWGLRREKWGVQTRNQGASSPTGKSSLLCYANWLEKLGQTAKFVQF